MLVRRSLPYLPEMTCSSSLMMVSTPDLVGENLQQVLDGRWRISSYSAFTLSRSMPGELVEAKFEDVIHLLVREDAAISLDARLAANQNAQRCSAVGMEKV